MKRLFARGLRLPGRRWAFAFAAAGCSNPAGPAPEPAHVYEWIGWPPAPRDVAPWTVPNPPRW
jgi:hypothetical protein